jgi:ubiquitin-activating enzyme E1
MLPLREKFKNPGSPFGGDMVMTDLIKFSEQQQHVAFTAVLVFAARNNNAFPRPNNADDAAEVVKIAKELISTGEIALEGFEVDETFCLKLATHAAIELQPLSAFLGGVLAQEVVKSTGKFTPIPGWMHFSAFEALPDASSLPTDTLPRGSRYDELAAIYGWNFVEKIGNLNYFMVGCGALGCEFLKNFTLNGICCGPKGMLTVTDADRIELSNLSRQFLFREHNVGHPKSRAACAMAQRMNSNFKVYAISL